MLQTNPKIALRFWSRVDKRGPIIVPELGECWTWGTRSPKIYGEYQVGQRIWLAHRLSWLLQCSALEDRQIVCHRCDNPRCVRPSHLFVGTQKDNMADCIAKGRYVNLRGEQGPHKIDAVDVRLIRFLTDFGSPHSCVADWFGISVSMIEKIRGKKSWAHLA